MDTERYCNEDGCPERVGNIATWEDDICPGCGALAEPVCGGDCYCCHDGGCQCWEYARDAHYHCPIPMQYQGNGRWVCSRGHESLISAAEEMAMSGAARLL